MFRARGKLEYNKDQIRSALSLDREEGAGAVEPGADAILLWVAINFIGCVVSEICFKTETKAKASIWKWVTVSDLAFALMVIDLYYDEIKKEVEKEKERIGIPVVDAATDDDVRPKKKKQKRTGAITNVVSKEWYSNYNTSLERKIGEWGGEAWLTRFNTAFEAKIVSIEGGKRDTAAEATANEVADAEPTQPKVVSPQEAVDNGIKWSTFV